MPKKRKVKNSTATYCRSYLVTLGMAFCALSLFIWQRDGADSANWPLWGFAFLIGSMLGGLTLIIYGLAGPSNQMESWAEVTSRHEASIIIMAIAYPVFLVLSPFYDKR
jgi:hypothetical protein